MAAKRKNSPKTRKSRDVKTPSAMELAFDVGHGSIGWAVVGDGESGEARSETEILGCGAVIFRADDCLASQRRIFRRQRRHIRSTRQRIARMKVLFRHLGVLTQTQLDAPGCAWPWYLAARVLGKRDTLRWPELWDVLRWYAHNRGYDGNRRWSLDRADESDKDTEKEENARRLLAKHNTRTMAETFCQELGVDPRQDRRRSSHLRFKGLNAAFPRAIVEDEVRRILRAHIGKLPGVDSALERALLGNDASDDVAWQAIPCPELRLPLRYCGGLLFGQLVPRFDNRIISACPASWAKVPSRNSLEFLRFRWAMQLANIRVGAQRETELRPLTADERQAVDAVMRERGSLTPSELKEEVRRVSGCDRHNLDTMLMHPDAKEALLLDPVRKLVTSDDLKPFWEILPERLQKRFSGRWRRGKAISLCQMREQLAAIGGDTVRFDAAVQHALDATNTRKRRRDNPVTLDELLERRHSPQALQGRAAYSRPVLVKAYEEVMAGQHPKEPGGFLCITEAIRAEQARRSMDAQTNNHLVRHRLLILGRLLEDIVAEYGAGERSRIRKITIEVNRDLREMSGMTAKEIATDLGRRIANHHSVAVRLEEALKGKRFDRRPIRITAGLIRKARIADDLGWTCPYTGQQYEPIDLVSRRVDRDHVVPRSARASDALDSLVITFSEVNRWKGNRTAFQFVQEEQGKAVPGQPNLSILSMGRYREFVEALDVRSGHADDQRRKERRRRFLLLPSYEDREFTPRDLTQTSQLVRLGALVLQEAFAGSEQKPTVVSLPGAVTGTVRRAWNLLGCLSLAAPGVVDEDGEVRTKADIRGITHLHHALDACVLALASRFIPNNGRIWELLVKRELSDAERAELAQVNVLVFARGNRAQIRDISSSLKEQIRRRLAERRVVQHVPASMDGLRAEQNMWRVAATDGSFVDLRQRVRQPDGARSLKEDRKNAVGLIGLSPEGKNGKLQALKAALVISENFAVALDPEPTIIPFHNVWKRLRDLWRRNAGKATRVVRNGQMIEVPKGNFTGTWRVFSVKNNASGIALDIGLADTVRLRNKTPGHRINVRLDTLIKDGMRPLKTSMTGAESCPTTSSA